MKKAQGQLIIENTKCRGCLSCQLACSFEKHKLFNPLKAYIIIERDVETEHTHPVIKPGCDLCDGHPACAEACPYGAIKFSE